MSTQECFNTSIRQAPNGWSYRYPNERQPFSFEVLDFYWWYQFFSTNWKWSLYAGAIYLVTIYSLKSWMKSRPAFNLKTPLFWWNLGLGIFSIMGFVRTAPRLLDTLLEPNGFYTTICRKTWMDDPLGFWAVMFVLSKLVELGDTIFLILRKRQLQLIGWYHHLVTLNMCWIVALTMEPIQVWFMVLNYGVHSLMYPYFALTSMGVKVPKKIAHVITTLQFSQMIIAFAINVLTMYYYGIGEDCARDGTSIKGFSMVYLSFIFLFGNLWIKSWNAVGRKQENVKKD